MGTRSIHHIVTPPAQPNHIRHPRHARPRCTHSAVSPTMEQRTFLCPHATKLSNDCSSIGSHKSNVRSGLPVTIHLG